MREVRFIKVVSGQTHNAAIDNKGFLYTWGDCTFNCLCHYDEIDLFEPR